MNIELVRPISALYINIALSILLISLLMLTTWGLLDHSEIIYRPNRFKVLNYLSVAILPAIILKIAWDAYHVYFRVPILSISNDSLSIKSFLFKNQVIPFANINKFTVKSNKYFSSLSINVRLTPFRKDTRRIHEVLFTKEAEQMLIKNGVNLITTRKPIIHLEGKG